MKKLTVLFAAALFAVCSFASTVTYVYPEGAVTNDYGWCDKNDMWMDWCTDVCAHFGRDLSLVVPLDSAKAASANYVADKLTPSNVGTGYNGFFESETYKAKWGALGDYVIAVQHGQFLEGVINPGNGLVVPDLAYETGDAYWRMALNSFWLESIRLSWPYSGDFSIAGTPAAFMKGMKMGFCATTNYTDTTAFILGEPFKEGESFLGWYANADFSGKKLTYDEIVALAKAGDVTIYAKMGEYIPNCEELWGMTPDTVDVKVATKAAGTVTYVNGGQFYIQDAYAGMLCYTSNHGLVEGDVVTLSGNLVLYNGYPELTDIDVEGIVKDGNNPVVAPVLNLSDLSASMKGRLFQIVTLQGLKLESAQDTKLFFVSSGDTVQYYNKAIKAADYTVGKTYDVTAVVTQYKGEVQLAGDPAKITRSATAGVDPSVYAVIKAENENNPGDTITYTITSDWLYSVNMNNWNANKPNPVAEQCRGMVVKDGILYLTYRSNNTPAIGDLKLVRYDAATGVKMDDLMLKEYIFREVADGSDSAKATRVDTDESTGIAYLKEDYKWNYAEFTSDAYIFGPNTDMRMDDAGNILVANLPTEGHVYQIWKIDEKTGEGELVVYMGGNSGVTDFAARFPDDPAIRLDRFDVVGDVTADAVIMAPSQNSSNVYEMDIFDGKWNGEGWHIICNNGDPAVAFSYSPRIEVVDDGEAFYVDGFATFPELFDIEGNLLESFNGTFDEAGESINPSCLELLYSKNAISSGTGVCGVHEFMCGGAYFFAMAGNSYEGSDTSIPSSTKVFRFKDGNRHFYEMMLAWELADNGFGNVKNAQFNYVQASVVVDELTTELYVYAAENGIGKYTIKASKSVEEETALDKVGAENNDVMKVVRDGKVYIVRNGVVYTIMGQMAE